MHQQLLLLNGPNINLMGKREKEVYGSFTLTDIENEVQRVTNQYGFSLACMQSNSEGTLIDCIQEADKKYDGVILNPAGYTHTSVALRDAILAINTPVIEVHISNIYKRESFRHTSITAAACIGQITGLGLYGYNLAAQAIVNYVKEMN
ncbi:type II 3-dehydroquinate dehydratase [Virgibacillus soli]|uniref:type II 3-dehydroquinate dehydratase n=1 Tax=Paracerasibacillus soli TaxID=480284 RepID=UPI0035EDD6CC